MEGGGKSPQIGISYNKCFLQKIISISKPVHINYIGTSTRTKNSCGKQLSNCRTCSLRKQRSAGIYIQRWIGRLMLTLASTSSTENISTVPSPTLIENTSTIIGHFNTVNLIIFLSLAFISFIRCARL